MKIKITLDVTVDPKEGEQEKTESFTISGESTKDFPMDKFAGAVNSFLSLIKGEREIFQPPFRPMPFQEEDYIMRDDLKN